MQAAQKSITKPIQHDAVQADMAATYKVLKVLDDQGILNLDEATLNFFEHASSNEIVINLLVKALNQPIPQ